MRCKICKAAARKKGVKSGGGDHIFREQASLVVAVDRGDDGGDVNGEGDGGWGLLRYVVERLVELEPRDVVRDVL